MKPSDQLYGLEETPPLPITLMLGIQHICIIAISFVFPVLLIRSMGGGEDLSQFMVSMSMLAGGVGVMAQGFHRGPVGSGYLCPTVCGPSFLAASMLCVKTGGLSLVLYLPDKAPETDKLLDHPECFDLLSGYLVRSCADKIRIRQRNGETRTQLHFIH